MPPDHALTVVVIALIGGKALERCLASVLQGGTRVLFVDRAGRCIDARSRLEIATCSDPSVPARRRFAVGLVDTPCVALLEDTVVPEPDWARDIVAALGRDGIGGVGGSVAIAASLPAPCRALGLCEYGRFQTHRIEQGARPQDDLAIVDTIPGANFAFRTDALLAVLPEQGDGLVDNLVFDRMHRSGWQFAYVPTMAVRYGEPHAAGARLSTRFNHGRIYASGRLSGRSPVSRGVAAIKAMMLPAVLFARSFREAGAEMRQDLPLLWHVALQHTAWSAGEFVGAVFGSSRRAAGQWT